MIHGKEIISNEISDALKHLPDWLKEYVVWHKYQRRNNLYSRKTKYLTVACINTGICGGISDRLRPIPYFLLLAHKTNRVLFIKWQKYQLEDFLLPPVGGLDWRLPEDIDIGEKYDATTLELSPIFENPKHPLNKKKNLVVRANRDLYRMLVKKEYFVTEDRPHGTFGDVWRVLFDPVPPLKAQIKKTMKSLKLTPKKYVSAHYRSRDRTFRSKHTAAEELEALWSNHQSDTYDIEKVIECAHTAPSYEGYPIYFTASNTNDVRYALDHSPFSKTNPGVLIGLRNTVRFHSDKPAHDVKFKEVSVLKDPTDLYPAFIDLYLLANSACVSFGKLGFGRLGGYIGVEECMIDGRDHQCRMQ